MASMLQTQAFVEQDSSCLVLFSAWGALKGCLTTVTQARRSREAVDWPLCGAAP